ncbi:MAG: ribosome recycling factor [Armatimonadetes bacterium]|nr:ribosome recycling factor [Armatimonadota bacterium]
MSQEIIQDAERRMQKAVEVSGYDFSTIRTGRANPVILENIKVDYYGTPTPLNQLAGISVPEPRLLLVTPWDKGVINTVLKAIQSSDIGMTPMSDGNVIRLNVPALTEERRKDLIKQLNKKAEEHRISIRNVRRDANERIKAQQKNAEISEDDAKREQEETQKLTDKYIAEVDKLTSAKEAELKEV